MKGIGLFGIDFILEYCFYMFESFKYSYICDFGKCFVLRYKVYFFWRENRNIVYKENFSFVFEFSLDYIVIIVICFEYLFRL